MVPALKFLVSFLRFAARTAPDVVPQVRKLTEGWAKQKGIPIQALLPALDDSLNEDVAKIDAEVDTMIDSLWNDDTKPD
jgi:hypothetical protein